MAVTVSIVATALIGLSVFLAGRFSVAGIDDAGMEAAPFTTCSSAQAVCSGPDTTLMVLGGLLMVTAVLVAFACAKRCSHIRAGWPSSSRDGA